MQLYVVLYHHHEDDYKGADSAARVVAVYDNARTAYLIALSNMFGEWREQVGTVSVDETMEEPRLSPDAEAILTPYFAKDGYKIAAPNFDSFDGALIKEIHTFIHSWLVEREGEYSTNASYYAWDVVPMTLNAPPKSKDEQGSDSDAELFDS